MIELTRLNGHGIYINCDLIKFAESAPDTMLTLVTGEKIMVRESCSLVRDRVRDWRVQILQMSGRTTEDAATTLSVRPLPSETI